MKESLNSHICKILQSDSLIIPKRLSIQSLVITYSRTNILFVNSNILLLWGCFTRIGDFTWRVSDLWRISGGYSQEMMGGSHPIKKTLKAYPKLSQHDRGVSVMLVSVKSRLHLWESFHYFTTLILTTSVCFMPCPWWIAL